VVQPGEVHALVGENGAGKSTLIKVLGGIYRRDEGEIHIRGRPVEIDSPHRATELGISIIHQELMLVPDMSVAQNVFLGRSPSRFGVLTPARMNAQAAEILERFEVSIDPRTPIRELGIAQQQMVEIAKAVSRQVQILVMDEPTATLTHKEIEQLFALIQRLKSQGVSVIYISHRLEEIFRIADRVTVLRDGATVETFGIKEADTARIVRLMVGRDLSDMFVKKDAAVGAEVLRVENLTSTKVRGISFAVRQGEIVGVAGLMGAGRTEMAHALFGLDPLTDGAIYVRGKKVRIKSPRDALAHGIGYLSEDRKRYGIIPQMSVESNVSIAILGRLCTLGVMRKKLRRELGSTYQERLRIRAPSMEALIKNLSGGNQQKALIARWLATDAPLLILDEPTRGIDVGAKHEIYALMSELAHQGIAILMISSELREVLAMSDRILVMHDGALAGVLEGEGATQEGIMSLAMGGARRDA
jgi:ribose transport system ATP-binding protein